MKFFRYKEVARLNFVEIDDELNNVDMIIMIAQ